MGNNWAPLEFEIPKEIGETASFVTLLRSAAGSICPHRNTHEEAAVMITAAKLRYAAAMMRMSANLIERVCEAQPTISFCGQDVTLAYSSPKDAGLAFDALEAAIPDGPAPGER